MISRPYTGAGLPLPTIRTTCRYPIPGCVALICALAFAIPAVAQHAESTAPASASGAMDTSGDGQGPAAQSGPAANSSEQVQEIVVTAQFRSQNLQSTPLAITAVTGQMLEARGQHTVEDVANRAPSVTLTTAGGGQGGSQTTAINIRGVGQSDFNLALEPAWGCTSTMSTSERCTVPCSI